MFWTRSTLAARQVPRALASRPPCTGLRLYALGPAPPEMTPGERQIYDKLVDTLEPAELDVKDVSGTRIKLAALVRSSNGDLGGCGDFYHVSVSSKAFKGLPLLKQHRLVQSILKEQISGFHGIQVGSSYP